MRAFLTYDWSDGRPRTLIAAERAFGWSSPLSLDIDGKPLFLHGMIDRLDVQRGRTLLRDLKSGKPNSRRPGDAPDHVDDLQLGLYGLVAHQQAVDPEHDRRCIRVSEGLSRP